MFEALGDSTRRQVLALLTAGPRSAGAIVEVVQASARISQPAVSQHLRVLRDAGLVSARVEGNRRIYALDQAGLDAAQAWLATLGDPLEAFVPPLDALATEVARGKRIRRAVGEMQGREVG